MITESELYWIFKLDDIRTLLGLCTALLTLASIISIVMTVAQAESDMLDDGEWRQGRFARCVIYISTIVSMLAVTLLPSTKQMAALKVIPAIVNSDIAKDVSSDAKELYKLGLDALKEKLAETNSNKEK